MQGNDVALLPLASDMQIAFEPFSLRGFAIDQYLRGFTPLRQAQRQSVGDGL